MQVERNGNSRDEVRRLAALNRAALAIAGDLDLDRVLMTILRTARGLVAARWGALGVPDGHGGFERFLHVGIPERQQRMIGHLPRLHGVLGALIADGRPIRTSDIRQHPDFGWYPAHHPVMRDFLGVPIRRGERTLGEIYLSGARSGRFSADDQRVIEMLAAHAGVAITTADLYAQAQTLAVIEERTRVARELHDAVSQRLFSMVYEAHAGALRAADDPGAATATLSRLETSAREALAEMRALVLALRPKSLERDGLAATLADHVEALRRAHHADIELRIEGRPALSLDEETAVLRIAQEALHNALRHAPAAPVSVQLRSSAGGTRLSVRDSGPGYDPDTLLPSARTMGLATMRERAAAVNAALDVEAAPGRGTEVRVFLPARPRR